MSIFELVKKFKKQLTPHRPLIEVLIYKAHLLHNLKQYQKQCAKQVIAPVLKANAYGHGMEPVLTCLKGQVLPCVCVDSHFEARVVHKHYPKLNCLVLGYCRLASIEHTPFSHSAFAITGLEQLQELAQDLTQPKNFHLKLDTGMFRQGIVSDQFKLAEKLIASNPNIRLQGIFSHLACPADELKTHKQIAQWNDAVKFFKQRFPHIQFWHLSASEGVRYHRQMDSNLIRLGIGFYGWSEQQAVLALRPALELRSLVTGFKQLKIGDQVGYDYTYTATQAMRLAVVPVGYFEGLDRRLSNQSGFFVQGTYCPIVGRISMDMTMVDVTGNKKIAFGDSVQVISPDPVAKNSLKVWSEICQTIPYELLVKIPMHLARTVVV